MDDSKMEAETSGWESGRDEATVKVQESESLVKNVLELMIGQGCSSIKQAIQSLCDCLHEEKFLVVSICLSDYAFEGLGSDWGRAYLQLYPEVMENFQMFCKDKSTKLEMPEEHTHGDDTVDDTDLSDTADCKQEIPIANVNKRSPDKRKCADTSIYVPVKATTAVTNVIQNTRPRRKSALKFLASIKREVVGESPVSEMLQTKRKGNKQKSKASAKVKNSPGEKESRKESPLADPRKGITVMPNDNTKDCRCEICERTFRNTFTLTSHMKTHKSVKKVNKQKFDDSSRSNSPDWNESDKSIESAAPKVSKRKVLQLSNTTENKCEICGKQFRNMYALISHSKVHKIRLEDRIKRSERGVDKKRKTEAVSVAELKEEGQMLPVPVAAVMKRVFEHDLNMYRCKLCDEIFQRRDKFLRHVRNSHPDKVGFQCQVCMKAFTEKCHLDKHFSSHTAEHSCDKCGKSYTTELKLRNHLRIHTMESFSCDQCGKAYKVKHMLMRHIETVHDGVRFPCSDCNKSFTRLPALKEHQQCKHSGKDVQMEQCTLCDKKYSSRGNLRIHVNTIHKQQFRHICDVCGLKFPNRTRLRIHYHLHTGELPHKCEHCSKAYRRKDSLVLHMKLHSGNDFCMCDICGKSFTQKTNLNHHRRFHNNEYKPYACTYCSETFRTGTAFRTHVLRAHKAEDLASSKSIILKCNFCPKLFSHREHLRAHENVHQGLKPYKCSTCQKSFSDRSNLRQHRTVHAKQSHKSRCETCSRSFSTDLLLKNHRLRCHPDAKSVVKEELTGLVAELMEEKTSFVDEKSLGYIVQKPTDFAGEKATGLNELDIELTEVTAESSADMNNSAQTLSTTATLVPVTVPGVDVGSSVNMEQMTVYFDESSAVVALVTMDDTQGTENATKQLEELLLSVQAEPGQFQ